MSLHQAAALIFYLFILLLLKFGCTAAAEEGATPRIPQLLWEQLRSQEVMQTRGRCRFAVALAWMSPWLHLSSRDSCTRSRSAGKQGSSWRPPAGLESPGGGGGRPLTSVSPEIQYRLDLKKKKKAAVCGFHAKSM